MIAHVTERALAALWLCGLCYAAGIFTSRPDPGSRLRDAMILGVLIPYSAGLLGLLYAPVCWSLLVAACVVAWYRKRGVEEQPRALGARYVIVLGVAMLIAWPQLVRPLLEGDSLWYHLPNAASWVHGHSVWRTSTAYWWYPSASELFAAALYCVANPLSVALTGLLPVLLLGFRCADFAKVHLDDELSSGIVGATVISLPTIALQAGALTNDVWQTAFFVEMLWCAGHAKEALGRALGIEIFVKPQSLLFGFLGIAATGEWKRAWNPALVVLALWLVRDAVLLQLGPMISPSDTAYPNIVSTTIAANLPAALTTLIFALVNLGPVTCLAFALGALSAVLPLKDRAMRVCGTAVFLLFAILPFAYNNPDGVLANGSSLRYAQITLVVGVLAFAALLRRSRLAVAALGLIAIGAGVKNVASIFWNDDTTHGMWVVAAVVMLAVVANFWMRKPLLYAATATVAIVYATSLAATNPVAYYDDALSLHGRRSAFFTWLERARPVSIVSFGMSTGAINVISPATDTRDSLNPARACDDARAHSSMLLYANVAGLSPCGAIVYQDDVVTLASPSGATPSSSR